MSRYYIDCRDYPGDVKCSVALSADSKEELLEAVVQHGIKVHGSKNILVDVFGVKYTWCWDSTYNSENSENDINYGQ